MKYIHLPAITTTDREIIKALIEAKSERLQATRKNQTDYGFIAIEYPGDFLKDEVIEHHDFRLALPDSQEQTKGREICGCLDRPTHYEGERPCSKFPVPVDFLNIGTLSTAPFTEKTASAAEDSSATPACTSCTCFDTENCSCKFDAEGWREFTGTDEVVGIEDECGYFPDSTHWSEVCDSIGFTAKSRKWRFRTRRHLPGCPMLKAADSMDEKAAHVKVCETEKPGLDLSAEIEVFKSMAKDPVDPLNWYRLAHHIADLIQKIQDHINGEGK
jgi:hypothetical protein